MTMILRHGADEQRVELDLRGRARLDDLLALEWFRRGRIDAPTIRQVVRESDKCRFTIDWTDGTECVRANQGRTIHRLELAQKVAPGVRTVNTTKEDLRDVMHELGLKVGFDVALEMPRTHQGIFLPPKK